LKESLQPAIRLARNGFPLYARLQGGLRYKREAVQRSPDAAKVFLTADGAVPELGFIIKQPDLANTLEAIAAQGAKGFYAGRVAQDLVSGCARHRGNMDLGGPGGVQGHRTQAAGGQLPRSAHRLRVAPSSGGIAVVDALNILSGFDLHGVDSVTRKHLVIEAMRRAYRDRAQYLGDPDFVSMPLKLLTSTDYAAGQRASIRTDKAMPSAMLPGIGSQPVGMQTTHFSVLDAAGNRVAGTISINLFFGTGYMPPKTGVVLNDTMDDFSINRERRIRSDWWATPPTPSRPTSAASPVWRRVSSRRRRA